MQKQRFSRSRNFVLLRTGQFIGDLGGNVSSIAVPATIILAMHASPMQIGALDAVSTGMIPLCSIFAGMLADRSRRRPLLIGANIVRLLSLLLIPAAFIMHHRPSMWLFFAVAIVGAAASSLFDAAYAGFVPQVVGDANIAAGTAKLAMGSSLAEAAGTGAAGALIGVIGAPIVITVNVVAFLVSTLTLAAMRVHEPAPVRPDAASSAMGDLREGIAVILEHPVLRTVTLSNAVAHFGGGMAAAVTTAYIYRELHLSPLVLGIVLGVANVGVVAAFFADRIAERLGMRRTLIAAHVVSAAGNAMLPLLAGMFPLLALLASRLLLTGSGPVFAVNDASLRLTLVPDALRGRATATARTIVWTALPAGSLAGGVVGQLAGLAPAMLVGAAITASAVLLLRTPALEHTASNACSC